MGAGKRWQSGAAVDNGSGRKASGGRRWCRANGYRGYTSYGSLNDLPQRFPELAELKRHLDRHAVAYAKDRLQMRKEPRVSGEEADPIIAHPDVRRMLSVMKAKISAARAICLSTGVAADLERMLKLSQALTVNDYEAGIVEQRTGRSVATVHTDTRIGTIAESTKPPVAIRGTRMERNTRIMISRDRPTTTPR